MRESDIQAACLEWLQWKGVCCWRNHSTGIYDPNRKTFRRSQSRKGVSDILGIIPCETSEGPLGRFLAIEVKGPKGRLTKEQEAFLTEVNAAGGIGMVVRSVDDLEVGLGPLL